MLHLGKIVYEGGAVTLGPVTCTGRAAWAYDDGQPRSCEDLWALGHTLNGVYTVKNPENSESCSASSLLYLYCDFTNPDGTKENFNHAGNFIFTCHLETQANSLSSFMKHLSERRVPNVYLNYHLIFLKSNIQLTNTK